MEQKSVFAQIKPGDKLSETQYYMVVDVLPGTGVRVRNERNFEFTISAKIVEEGIYSAAQFIETKEVTRTELIEIFSHVGDTVFTVNFNKQATAKAVNEAIESTNKGKILPIKEMKKIIKDAFDGEERTLVGYLISTETGFGRSLVIDLEEQRGDKPDWDARLRQVDHRTLNWLISKNIKYTVRK